MAQQMRTCPECRRINPPFAPQCDCGYDFATGVMGRPDPPPPSEPTGGSKTAGIGCLVFAVLLLFVCVGNLLGGNAPDPGTPEGAGYMCGTILWPGIAFFVAYKLLRRKS